MKYLYFHNWLTGSLIRSRTVLNGGLMVSLNRHRDVHGRYTAGRLDRVGGHHDRRGHRLRPHNHGYLRDLLSLKVNLHGLINVVRFLSFEN